MLFPRYSYGPSLQLLMGRPWRADPYQSLLRLSEPASSTRFRQARREFNLSGTLTPGCLSSKANVIRTTNEPYQQLKGPTVGHIFKLPLLAPPLVFYKQRTEPHGDCDETMLDYDTEVTWSMAYNMPYPSDLY